MGGGTNAHSAPSLGTRAPAETLFLDSDSLTRPLGSVLTDRETDLGGRGQPQGAASPDPSRLPGDPDSASPGGASPRSPLPTGYTLLGPSQQGPGSPAEKEGITSDLESLSHVLLKLLTDGQRKAPAATQVGVWMQGQPVCEWPQRNPTGEQTRQEPGDTGAL